MTAPISNGPTTTRLHHYAGHYFNPGAFSLIMVVFWLGLTTFVTEVLVRRFELRWFDDVCNVGRPLVARPGPATAYGHRSQAHGSSGALHTSGARSL